MPSTDIRHAGLSRDPYRTALRMRSHLVAVSVTASPLGVGTVQAPLRIPPAAREVELLSSNPNGESARTTFRLSGDPTFF